MTTKKELTTKERIAVVETKVDTIKENITELKSSHGLQLKFIFCVGLLVVITNLDKLPMLLSLISNTTAFAGS